MRCNKYFTLILLQFVIYVCVWTSWALIYEYLVLLCKIGCDKKFGVKDRPKYEGHEFEKDGTERCEVTIYMGKSEEFPDITEA